VFDQINGLPVHILVIHAAVVFVPLLALGAIVYAVVPGWRSKIGWAVISLAILAPIVTFVSRESGEKLYDRLIANGVSGKGKEMLDAHLGFGTRTFWFTVALGGVTLLMTLLTLGKAGSGRRILGIVFALAAVALAAVSGYYVYKTGDSGAKAVWGTY